MLRLQPLDLVYAVGLAVLGWAARRVRVLPIGLNWPLTPDGRRVRSMQLTPVELGEPDWKVVKEKVWTSPVVVDSSTDPNGPPRSTMSTRDVGAADERRRQTFSAHIIPLPSQADAEALAVTLLEREKPSPDRELVVSERRVDSIGLEGASSVAAREKETAGRGMSGRVLTLAGAVGNIAFGLGYVCFGEDGWPENRFIAVAQLQVAKIRSQLRPVERDP